MSKIRRFLVKVDTELCGTDQEYYAEDVEDLEKNDHFLNICDMLAYENYQDFSHHFEYKDEELGLDIESDEYHEIESERYYYLIRELTDEEYEEDEEYYNELENIW